MIIRETHGLDVSLRGENSHIFCTCSNGSMGRDMATTATCLFSFEVGHEIYMHPLYNHGQVYDHVLIAHSTIYYSLVGEMILVCYLPDYFMKLQWIELRCILLRYCLYYASSCKICSKLLIGILYDDLVLFIMDDTFWAGLLFIVR